MSKSEIAKMEADGAAVKQFIETHWSGNAGDFTPRERACLAGLLGVMEQCDVLCGRIKTAREAIRSCEAVISQRQGDYDRLMRSGQRDAAGQAVSGIPQITAELDRLQAHAVELVDDLKRGGIDDAGLASLRAAHAAAHWAAHAQHVRLLLLEKAHLNGEIHLRNALQAIEADAGAE